MSSSLPNIVLIYPDQMRYDATSRSGNKLVKTPAFDALAEAGAYFENAYTSFPLCCPFRASLMSGAYAHSIGMCTNHYPINLNWPGTFLPQAVKTRGYETAWIGKWHLNGGNKFDYVPREYRLGFDEFIGYSRGHHYINGIFYRNDDRTPRTSRRFEPEYQTGHLLEFMGRMVRNDRPFMAMICYGIPHSPVDMSVEPYLNMYSPENVELPPTVPSWKAVASARYRAKYYGLVSCVDDQLARIDAWLRENGIFDNTAVIFVSDHGDMCGEHGLEYKSSFHEASAHVPLAIRWPSVIAGGTRVSQIVDPAVDLFPTILEMCGAELPSFAQGTSLLRAACSGYEPEREDVGYYELLKVALGLITAVTLLYTVRLKERLPAYHIHRLAAVVVIGVLLGVCSAFLGIGGGPINIAVLTLAFSMDTKKAAATSLYIIAFSQLSNLASSVLKGTVPQFVPMELVLMVSAGILGGLVGSEISKKISTETTNKLLAVFLVVVIIMCVYNAYRFGGEVICRR